MHIYGIRPIVICLFNNDRKILVLEGQDSISGEVFYRPIGGGIEFGEHSHDALIREVKEEIGAEIHSANYLGTIENIFTFNGEEKHEIVQVYDARFVDNAIYNLPSLEGVEDNGESFKILWKPIFEFQNGKLRLVPPKLIEFLPAT